MKLKALGLAFLGALAISASAADIKPGVVYDKAGKHDKSFNEMVSVGVAKFYKDTGIKVKEIEPRNDAEVQKGLDKLAHRGYSPIVAVGFAMASATSKAAQKYPNIKFTLIDMVVPEKNVQNVVFAEHEGSFLVGALAAMKTQSNTIGFIGGMDIPLIRKFACGYEQGAKYVKPNIKIVQNMTGSTPAAFNDPANGAELAKSQIDQGADVIYAAAGGTGIGVLQTAADKGIYSIGVDSNQNYMHPGSVLTSMVKRVDLAAYESFKAAMDGTWKPGVKVMDLKAGGVDYAYDQYNKNLITPEMKARVDQIKADIIAGKIKVHDYMSDNKCVY